MSDEIVKAVTEFVSSRSADTGEIEIDDRLLEEGLIDSLGLLDLVSFIENQYGLFVDDADVNLDTFGSIRSIVAYIESNRSQS